MYRRLPGGTRDIRTIFYYTDLDTADQMAEDMYSDESESEEFGDDAVRSVRVTGVNKAYYSEPCIDETPASYAYVVYSKRRRTCIHSMTCCTDAFYAQTAFRALESFA